MKKSLLVCLIMVSAVNLQSQQIGLQLYSLRNEFKAEGAEPIFSKIKEWGITLLEQGNEATLGYSNAEYVELLDRYDLKMVSASASFEELEKDPQKVLRSAKGLGAEYVVCFWIPHRDTIFTIKETDRAIKVFNEAGKVMKSEGITFAYHPHGYEFRPYEDALLLDHMIKNAYHFEFEMDVYWFAHAGEDPIKWLKKYPDKFKLLHLKDCQKGTKGNLNGTSDVETNVTLGSGQIDIEAIVQEARKMEIKYMFIEDESSKAVQQIPQSLEFLRQIE